MKVYKKASRILLITSFAFASTNSQAHDYSFLKLLKVGQCAYLKNEFTNQKFPVIFYLVPCDFKSSAVLVRKITNIGIDYIILDKEKIITAQSISEISPGN